MKNVFYSNIENSYNITVKNFTIRLHKVSNIASKLNTYQV